MTIKHHYPYMGFESLTETGPTHFLQSKTGPDSGITKLIQVNLRLCWLPQLNKQKER